MSYAGSVGARTRSAEENREGEMKRQLTAAGIYEEGMSGKEMEDIMHVIESSMSQSGDLSRGNSMETPDPPRSDPNKSRSTRDSCSPELTSNVYQTRQKPLNKKPLSDDEELPEPSTASAHLRISPSPPHLASMSISTASEGPAPPNILKKTLSVPPKLHPSLVPSKIEIWRIDPLDCKVKDVPLKPLKKFLGPKKAPPKFKMVDGIPQVPEELWKFVDLQLREVSRRHYEENKHKFNNEVEWGEPIKVCTGTFNNSLDKDFRPERELPDYRLRPQAPEKPKKPQETDPFSFDSDSEDFESSRKRAKPSSSRTGNPPSQPARRGRGPPKLHRAESEEKTDEKDVDWTDRAKPSTSRKRTVKNRELPLPEVTRPPHEPSPEYEPMEIRGRQSSQSEEFPELQEYPRRVIPPNPSKPRGKKMGAIANLLNNRPQLTVERIPRKKQETLSEDQIEAMITDDEDEPIYVPQKSTQRTSKRAENAVAMLEKARDAEEEEKRERKERQRLKVEQEDRERTLRVSRRIKEEKQKARLKELENQQKKEKYASGRPVRLGKRVEVLGDSRGPEGDVLNWDAGNRPTAAAEEVDMFPDNSTEVPKVQCPMCMKWFPQGQEIETHADTCADSFGGEGAVDVEEVPRTPSPAVFECMRCKFITRDGHEYEEHTAHCLKDGVTAGGSHSIPIVVPDSPIRTFSPLSQIKNSEIDYKDQNNTRRASPRGGSRKRRKQT